MHLTVPSFSTQFSFRVNTSLFWIFFLSPLTNLVMKWGFSFMFLPTHSGALGPTQELSDLSLWKKFFRTGEIDQIDWTYMLCMLESMFDFWLHRACLRSLSMAPNLQQQKNLSTGLILLRFFWRNSGFLGSQLHSLSSSHRVTKLNGLESGSYLSKNRGRKWDTESIHSSRAVNTHFKELFTRHLYPNCSFFTDIPKSTCNIPMLENQRQHMRWEKKLPTTQANIFSNKKSNT